MTTRTPLQRIGSLVALVALALFLGACATGGGGSETESTTYDLAATGAGGTNVSGTVTFTKVDDATTEITIDLDGTPPDGMHPAHIHEGDATPGGGIYVTLGTVDGASGMSTITVTNADDNAVGNNEAVTYEDLLAYDGYVNIHLSADQLGTIVAQGEVGAGASPSEED